MEAVGCHPQTASTFKNFFFQRNSYFVHFVIRLPLLLISLGFASSQKVTKSFEKKGVVNSTLKCMTRLLLYLTNEQCYSGNTSIYQKKRKQFKLCEKSKSGVVPQALDRVCSCDSCSNRFNVHCLCGLCLSHAVSRPTFVNLSLVAENNSGTIPPKLKRSDKHFTVSFFRVINAC